MTEKEKILSCCNEIITQINTIISLNLNSQEKRNNFGITIFSPNCPMCKPYFDLNNYKCNFNICPLSNQVDRGCLLYKSKPKDKFNIEQIKIRKYFWVDTLNYLKKHNNFIFEIENRSVLQKKIFEIDNNLIK